MSMLKILMGLQAGGYVPPARPNFDAVIIMGGQSNCPGYSDKEDLNTTPLSEISPSLTRQFDKVEIWNPYTGGNFQKLKASTDPQFGGVQNECFNVNGWYGFGGEIGFAQRWQQENDGKLYIIKDGAGATNIAQHTKDNPAGLYERLQSYFMAAAAAITLPSRICFYWDQGEADSGNTGYAAALTQLVSDMIADGMLNSDSRIAIVGKPAVATVDVQQQVFVASNANSGLIDTSWATFITPLHYDADSMLKISGNQGFNILFNTTGSINGL